MGTATLNLELTTATGTDLNDFVRVELFSIQGSQRYQNNVAIARRLSIQGIDASPTNIYRVLIMPTNYRIMQFFQMLADGQTKTSDPLRCPVDPGRVMDIQAPPFDDLDARLKNALLNSAVPRFVDPGGRYITGAELYAALGRTPRLKASLLNIATKSAATPLRDGKSCLEHYTGLIRIEQDRFFARTTAALFEEAHNSPLFHSAGEALHDPVPGYRLVGSYKTFDRYGNLQLTFQRSAAGDYVVDVDIDDAQGVQHIFQVLRNAVTGPTDPYDIHDILIADQNLNPGYTFVFAQAAAVTTPGSG